MKFIFTPSINRVVVVVTLLLLNTIALSQNVGIGTTTPLARLHVTDSIVLFSATGSGTSVGDLPISGPGKRLLWYPQKGAFRVGSVNSANWDDANIGAFSFASGYNTMASAQGSTAMGYGSGASAPFSTAIGFNCNSSKQWSVALGYQANASGYACAAIGSSTTASGDGSFASGNSTTASGANSTAMGTLTTASANSSTAVGLGVVAKAKGSISLGIYNDDTDTPDPLTTDLTDRIFQLGNGVPLTHANAITVLRNGNTGLGVLTPANRLDILSQNNYDVTNTEGDVRIGNSDYRIKFGIATLGGGAGDARIMQYGQNGGYNVLSLGSQGNSILFLNGNLNRAGIGTNSPSEKLEVIGNVRASAFLTTSDARLKTNITPIKSSLANLLLLNAYTFNWKDQQVDSSRQVGLIAQEVEEVYPDLVHRNETGELSVNYSGMIPLLLNAIKEQQEQIDELKSQVRQLKQKRRQ